MPFYFKFHHFVGHENSTDVILCLYKMKRTDWLLCLAKNKLWLVEIQNSKKFKKIESSALVICASVL